MVAVADELVFELDLTGYQSSKDFWCCMEDRYGPLLYGRPLPSGERLTEAECEVTLKNVPVADIVVPRKRHRSNLERIEALADSIQTLGLLIHPITVTESFRLIAGARRLAAVKLLGWERIPAYVETKDKLRLELIEIAENLERQNLTYLEEGQHYKRSQEIHEALYPETKRGGAPGAGRGKGKRKKTGEMPVLQGGGTDPGAEPAPPPKSFVKEMAEKTGRDETTIRRKKKVADVLPETVQEILIGTPAADSGTDLHRLAQEKDAETQRLAAEKLAAGTAKNAYEAIKQVQAEAAREELSAAPAPPDANVITGDFRKEGHRVPDESVDLIFTDPPYDKPTVLQYGDLAAFARRVLKPGGHLICYYGQYALPDVLGLVTPHLDYHWMFCVRHTGASARRRYPSVYIGWKPLLWFTKGDYKPIGFVSDFIESEPPAKDLHPWEQSTREAAEIIDKLTRPGAVICDPYGGGGTTAATAKALDRRYITFEIDPEAADRIRARLQNKEVIPNVAG